MREVTLEAITRRKAFALLGVGAVFGLAGSS
jgi:hypothetical protein